ncbi:KfrB domain-containing protein [Paraburkholderia sp. A3RO-2L]|uniref:KfrB domain-containing protein n=1 Tax=Paraburkholderia sp. A3RO-2L TaxID=3028376 RepID=UPI003DA85339
MDAKTFEDVVGGKRFAPSSIEAARMVLVDGIRPGEAAAKTGALPAHVSRTTKKIVEAEREWRANKLMTSSVDAVEKSLSASYTLAVQTARERMGAEATVLRAAEPGMEYVGTSVAQTDMHLVQNLGRGQLVIHELAKLERVPNLGAELAIRYPREPFRPALVSEQTRTQSRGGISR